MVVVLRAWMETVRPLHRARHYIEVGGSCFARLDGNRSHRNLRDMLSPRYGLRPRSAAASGRGVLTYPQKQRRLEKLEKVMVTCAFPTFYHFSDFPGKL